MESFIRTFSFGLVMAFVFFACDEKKLEPEPELPDNPQEVVARLNKNVEGLKNLANAFMTKDSVAIYSIRYNNDGSVLYQLNMREGKDVELYSEIVADKMGVPELSMTLDDGVFCWMVDGILLLDANANSISVTDEAQLLAFVWQDGHLCFTIGNSSFEYPPTKAYERTRDVAINYDVDNQIFEVHLSSGFVDSMPTVASFHLLKECATNQAFYKDVFLDSGIGLTSRKSLAAAKYLGLSLEGLCLSRSDASQEERDLQNYIFGGSADDFNGRLLYPDGQPRYKLLFVNGGSASTHGKSLNDKSRDNMIGFIMQGGSYVGTCAGAFFVSCGNETKNDVPYYLHAWPSQINYTRISNDYTDMVVEPESPLLNYYHFGGDMIISDIRHNGGGYPASLPSGTEVLARYSCPLYPNVDRKPSIWSYKMKEQSGRIVMEGSHPEEVSDGERRDLTAAMMLYAMDGCGSVAVKGYLKNGQTREMNCLSEESIPAFTRIGDKQVHHFAVFIPPHAKNAAFSIGVPADTEFQLMLSKDTYAFPTTADFSSNSVDGKAELSFISLEEGIWYVGVQCLTTVSVEETEYGQRYVGRTDVLNGVPYTITVVWEIDKT